jgi:hypothetical protein
MSVAAAASQLAAADRLGYGADGHWYIYAASRSARPSARIRSATTTAAAAAACIPGMTCASCS